MAGYFGGMGGASPGMGMLMSPYASQINPQALAMMAAAQNGGQGAPPGAGAAPQMPPAPQKAMSNAGAMPSPIATQPQNPMISQLMQNPQMLQNLLKQIGGGMGGGNTPGAFGSSWLTPNMAQGAWNSMGGGY